MHVDSVENWLKLHGDIRETGCLTAYSKWQALLTDEANRLPREVNGLDFSDVQWPLSNNDFVYCGF
jgi:hypothetical protein